jgi:hypothetical protein
VRNKIALAVTVLAVSIVASACGGTGGNSGLAEATSSTTPRPPTGKQKPTDPHKSCDAQGVNSTQLRPGACTEGGVGYVVRNYGGAVKLKTLGVAITGVSVSPVAAGNGRRVSPRRDAFLRVTLQVQNRDKVAHRFGPGQTMLGVGAENYVERKDIERNVHPEAIARVSGGMIGPGETLRGDVIFDISRESYEVLNRQGRFFIWNFGGHAAASIPRTTGQLGQIRLYAAEPNQ